MRTGKERAHGPYAHGQRWRVVFVGANGSSETESFESIEAANAAIADFRRLANARTLGEAVRDYLMAYPGRESSRTTARHRLTALLGLVEGDRQLSALTPAVARKLVSTRVAAVAFETAAGELRYASRFADWCIAQGWMRANPFAGITLTAPPEGRSRGKPQLRVNEVRAFMRVALADESPESTAVLMTLLMGMRAHEVVERVARDVDDDGRLLVIAKSKTRAGVRTLAIPTVLQDRVRKLIAGQLADDRIFNMTRYALHYHVVKMAKLAGVPRVTPHGLRGTFASLAVVGSLPGITDPNGPLTPGALATMLGHNDDGSTAERHYMAPGTRQSAEVQRVEDFLARRVVTSAENALPTGKSDELN